MAETPKHTAQDGCGLVGAILRRGVLLRLSPRASVAPIPRSKNNKLLTSLNSKRQRGSSGKNEMTISDFSMLPKAHPKAAGKPSKKPSFDASQTTSIAYNKKLLGQRRGGTNDFSKRSMSFFNNSSMISGSQVVNSEYTKQLRREPTFTSGELSVTSQRRSNASNSGRLYRASAGSVMLLSELGNLNQKKHKKSMGSDKNSRDSHEREISGKVPAMGNILRKQTETNSSYGKGRNGLVNKMDPDSLKSLGNEKFKEGRFEEALDLYNHAIALDPSKASFYSNKSAALMSLGHLMEAVSECAEAIRLDPHYHNAHYRMARLYIRLGEAEKAINHYEQSGRKTSGKDLHQAEKLEKHMRSCFGARGQKDWDALLNESQDAITLGADSAPQIYAMQAEALLELRRHEEAYKVIDDGPTVNFELCTKFLGTAETARLMMVRSRVYLNVGRFEDAVGVARHATRVDTSDEVYSLATRINSVASSRITGNKLFNSSRYPEATLVYSSALEEAPYNSVLLCNRAACRSKLRQHEKAVEDCTAALYVRPSYSKARLRRADSNAKLERWEAALKDYEILMQEVPGDEEVMKGYSEATQQVKKQQKNESREPPRKSSALNSALKNEQKDEIVTAAAQFYHNTGSVKTSQGMDASSRAKLNCAAIEFNRPVTTLQEIFTH